MKNLNIMKKTFLYTQLISILLFFGMPGNAQQNPFTEEVIANEFYAVYSGVNNGANLAFLTNIYVFKGMNDTVWIFGSGCGDIDNFPTDTGDIRYYQFWETGSITWKCNHNSIEDANKVDTIIKQNFGLTPANVKLQFITPHHHADHAAPEFLVNLTQMGYNVNDLSVYVHVGDSAFIGCTQPCCGNVPCTNKLIHPGFGASFNPTWPSNILSNVVAIGTPTDVCGTSSLTFTTVMGSWNVTSAPDTSLGGHTPGTVDLEHNVNKYRIVGSNFNKYTQCDTAGWTIFNIHDSVPNISSTPVHELSAYSSSVLNIFPNPATHTFTVQTKGSKTLLGSTEITIYDFTGREIKRIKNINGSVVVDSDDFPSGIYFIVLTKDTEVIDKREIIIE